MRIAKVVGVAVATVKDQRLEGGKLPEIKPSTPGPSVAPPKTPPTPGP